MSWFRPGEVYLRDTLGVTVQRAVVTRVTFIDVEKLHHGALGAAREVVTPVVRGDAVYERRVDEIWGGLIAVYAELLHV